MHYTISPWFGADYTGEKPSSFVKEMGFADNPFFGKVAPKVSYKKVEGEKPRSEKPECQTVFDKVREKWLVTEKGDLPPL